MESRFNPKYRLIEQQLLGEIEAGKWREGDKFPTEQILSKRFNVSRTTIVKSIIELTNGGYLKRKQGSGTFVANLNPKSQSLSLSSLQFKDSEKLTVFGLVVPEASMGYYPSLINGFHNAAAELGCQVIYCDSDNDIYKQADAILNLIDKNVAGFAIVPTSHDRSVAYQLRPAQEKGIATVTLHRPIAEFEVPLIELCFDEIGRQAGTKLVKSGHRRVAGVFPCKHKSALLMMQMLSVILKQAGGQLNVKWLSSELQSVGSLISNGIIRSTLEELFSLPDDERPTAIFSSFDPYTEAIYLNLIEMGIKVPGAVSLLSFGGKNRKVALQQKISAITLDEQGAGIQAVKLLEEICRGIRPINDTQRFKQPLGFHCGETLTATSRTSLSCTSNADIQVFGHGKI